MGRLFVHWLVASEDRSASLALPLAVAFSVAACAPMQVGEPCTVGHCAAGAECAMVVPDQDRCVALCEPSFDGGLAFGLCAGGETCWPLGYGDHPEWFGCYPGGAVPVGSPCNYPVECVRGAFCIFETVGTPGLCAPACGERCVPDGEPCATDQDCVGTCVCTSGDCAGPSFTARCAPSCDASTGAGCDAGTECMALSNGMAACLAP